MPLYGKYTLLRQRLDSTAAALPWPMAILELKNQATDNVVLTPDDGTAITMTGTITATGFTVPEPSGDGTFGEGRVQSTKNELSGHFNRKQSTSIYRDAFLAFPLSLPDDNYFLRRKNYRGNLFVKEGLFPVSGSGTSWVIHVDESGSDKTVTFTLTLSSDGKIIGTGSTTDYTYNLAVRLVTARKKFVIGHITRTANLSPFPGDPDDADTIVGMSKTPVVVDQSV